MKICIITVGKKHSTNVGALIADYEKRLTKSCDLSWEYVPTSNIDSESTTILGRTKPDDHVILLDETGEQVLNQVLAEKIEDLQNLATKRVVFVIGGAYGVNHQVISRANYTLSLSLLVFPHMIVRLILVEQIYRSYCILGGSAYHHY